jgi:hypothetical protein
VGAILVTAPGTANTIHRRANTRFAPTRRQNGSSFGANTRFGPTDHQNTVDVIGHNLEGTQVQVGIIAGKAPPRRMHQLACEILYHPPLDDIPEQREPVLRADRYGICAG